MSDKAVNGNLIGRRFVFSLSLAIFGTGMLDVLASLFLSDIAKTFFGNSSSASIAIVSQMVTISGIAAVVVGILNGFLVVKVNHKKLLIAGAACITVGAIGCFLAPNLLFMMIFYPFDGIGTILVGAMAFTLIGESIPLEKRARSVSFLTAGGIFSSAMGFAIAGFVGAAAGWRSYLLWYVLPISLFAIGLAYLSIPARKNPLQTQIERPSLSRGFRDVLACKSATVCLFSYTLMAIAAVWSFFAATFWIKQYSVPVQTVGLLTLVVVLIYMVGSLVGGPVVNLLGRKVTVVASWFGRGVFILSIVLVPGFWGAFTMSCIATFVGGIAMTSGHSFNLEQVPKSRGTMMSLSGVFGSIGASLGTALGGLVLGTSGFKLLGITLGLFGVAASIAILIFAQDPSKSHVQTQKS